MNSLLKRSLSESSLRGDAVAVQSETYRRCRDLLFALGALASLASCSISAPHSEPTLPLLERSEVEVRNFSQFPHTVAVAQIDDGREFYFAVLKESFDLSEEGELKISERQASIHRVTTIGRERCKDQVTQRSDLLPFKDALEISVVGETKPGLAGGGSLVVGSESAELRTSGDCYEARPREPHLGIPLSHDLAPLVLQDILAPGRVRITIADILTPFVLVRGEDLVSHHRAMFADTITIFPKAGRLEVSYRAAFPITTLPKSVDIRVIFAHDLDPNFRYASSHEPPAVRVTRSRNTLALLRSCAPPRSIDSPWCAPQVLPPQSAEQALPLGRGEDRA